MQMRGKTVMGTWGLYIVSACEAAQCDLAGGELHHSGGLFLHLPAPASRAARRDALSRANSFTSAASPDSYPARSGSSPGLELLPRRTLRLPLAATAPPLSVYVGAISVRPLHRSDCCIAVTRMRPLPYHRSLPVDLW